MINENISKLRNLMNINNIDTYIITKFDPHMSEDSEIFYNCVKYITGFTGSAANVIVTKDYIGLWTDGRYYIQADKEVFGTDIVVHREDKNYLEYGIEITPEHGTIGFNGNTVNYQSIEGFDSLINSKNINIKHNIDLINNIWDERPCLSKNKVYDQTIENSGKSVYEKLNPIILFMAENNIQYYLVTSLDSISWLLNLKGSDVKNNTFFASYLIIENNNTLNLFIDNEKISFDTNKFNINNYDEINNFIDNIKEGNILIEYKKINYNLYNSCKHLNIIKKDFDIIEKEKAIKNKIEIENLDKINIDDAIAMIKSIIWTKENADKNINEFDVANKFDENRGNIKNFLDTSFTTIAAYMGNAAMAHYHPDEKKSSLIKNEGIILVDSGGQYSNGTTDITRTFALGPVSEEIKNDFTYVLKSHIALAIMIFKENTKGLEINSAARIPMWKKGLDFSHGLGHGLGYCGCVHEGPQSISSRSSVVLEPNMIITNEPGIYRENKHGIRIENTVIVEEYEENEFGKFYNFRTISYCPIDIELINVELLNEEEINWINNYHKDVYNKLNPFLDNNDSLWLKNATKNI